MEYDFDDLEVPPLPTRAPGKAKTAHAVSKTKTDKKSKRRTAYSELEAEADEGSVGPCVSEPSYG